MCFLKALPPFENTDATTSRVSTSPLVPSNEWRIGQAPDDARATWEHITRSPCHSIEKGHRRLGYEPRHSSLAAVQEAVTALIAAGKIEMPKEPA